MTIAAVSPTVANTLFNRLERFFGTDEVPDESILRQLEREADTLAKVDAASSSMVKAGIAALRWDADDVHYWIENALRLHPSAEMHHNAAVTYDRVVQLKRSATVCKKMLNLFPKNTSLMNFAVRCFFYNGQLHRVAALHENTSKNGTLTPRITSYFARAQAIKRLGVEQERLEWEIAAAYDVLRHNQKRVRRWEVKAEKNADGSESGLLAIYFFGTLNEEMVMELQLAEVFSRQPDWNPSLMSVELHYELPPPNPHAD